MRNYPCPNDPEKMGKPAIVDKIALDGIEFLQATTSATSTIMSVTSMMTAIPAYYLSRNFDDIRVDKSNFESFASGFILEKGDNFSINYNDFNFNKEGSQHIGSNLIKFLYSDIAKGFEVFPIISAGFQSGI